LTLIYDFDFAWSLILKNTLNLLVVSLLFVFMFILSGFSINKLINRIKKSINEENKSQISIPLIVFYGFLANFLIVIFLTAINVLNKSWVIWLIYCIFPIIIILLDLLDVKFNIKDFFSNIKRKLVSLKTTLKKTNNWFIIIIFIAILLYIFSSIILPYAPGEDMMGHSFYIQLIFEQNTLFPSLYGKISPLIITTDQHLYPMLSHYIAVTEYSLIAPLYSITTPEFMNCYYKIWILFLPFIFKDLSTSIFGKKVGRISFILLLIFSPAYFVIWRWGGYAYIFGLVFLTVSLYFIFNWKNMNKFEYYLVNIISLLITFFCHTIVFTFLILFSISGSFLFLAYKSTNNDILKDPIKKKPFILSNLINIVFFSGLILMDILSKLQKYKNSIIGNKTYFIILAWVISGIAILLIINNVFFVLNRSKYQKEKLGYLLNFINLFGFISFSIVSILMLAYIEPINNFISSNNIFRTVLADKSKLPIISFDLIGASSSIINFESSILTTIVQFFANVYITGLLGLFGFVFLTIKLKNNDDSIKKIIFFAFTMVIFYMFLIYGLSQIEILNFLYIKFPFAHYMIRYERLFITMLLIIAPQLGAYFINNLQIYIEQKEPLTISADSKSLWSKIKKLYFSRTKLYNNLCVLFISLITLGTYFYVGFFKTNLYYTNDYDEASQWILDNTDEDDWFIVDRYGSWITFTTGRKVSFIFLTGSQDLYRAPEITRSIIYRLITDTAREILVLKSLGYEYLYLSAEMPNDVLSLFHHYYHWYYTNETFEQIPYIDVVFSGETDMILYLNSSSFTHETYQGIPPFSPERTKRMFAVI